MQWNSLQELGITQKTGQLPTTIGLFTTRMNRLRDIHIGISIVPGSLKRYVDKYLEHEVPGSSAEAYNWTLTHGEKQHANETMDRVFDIVKLLVRKDTPLDTVGWNQSVNSPLLGLGRVQDYTSTVGERSASVYVGQMMLDSKYLPPPPMGKEVGMEGMVGKTADYVIHLEPTEEEAERISALLNVSGMLSVNPTVSPLLTRRPVSVAVAVKDSTESPAATLARVTLFTVAQMKQWRFMEGRVGIKATAEGLFVPMLTVHKAKWFLSMLELKFVQKEDKFVGEFAVHGELFVGDVSSVLGVYQVLALISCLHEWAALEFRNWYRMNFLGFPRLSERPSTSGLG